MKIIKILSIKSLFTVGAQSVEDENDWRRKDEFWEEFADSSLDATGVKETVWRGTDEREKDKKPMVLARRDESESRL